MQADQGGSGPQVINIEQITDDFRKSFKKAYKHMCAPGDTMYNTSIRENTDFSKLLHKEGLWSLYTYGEGRSLMYHLCRGYEGLKQENSPVRPKTGDCTACDSKSPDEIRGLWTLHNFDWVQESGGRINV